MKNYTDEAKTQRKINVKKIVTLKEVLNYNFDELKFKINNLKELAKLKNLSKKDGKTKITFQIFMKIIIILCLLYTSQSPRDHRG